MRTRGPDRERPGLAHSSVTGEGEAKGFRTVVRDGLIVINTHGEVPDGTPVEVMRTADRATNRAGKKAAKKSKKKSKQKTPPLDNLPGFGMWKDRPEWKGLTTLEIMARLRERSLGRGRRG